jgi:hypothetical protein
VGSYSLGKPRLDPSHRRQVRDIEQAQRGGEDNYTLGWSVHRYVCPFFHSLEEEYHELLRLMSDEARLTLVMHHPKHPADRVMLCEVTPLSHSLQRLHARMGG